MLTGLRRRNILRPLETPYKRLAEEPEQCSPKLEIITGVEYDKRLIQRLKKKRESRSVSPYTITETSFGGRNPLTVSSIRSKQASQRYKTTNMMAQSRKGQLSTTCLVQQKRTFLLMH